ncbi:iron complex outermembrane receptor protein [Methylobacterium sp. BE186]|uniref:TonB-dependent siderophore receptor n=1 Tax=Methylobacterium sp. BE186 TaxID=2817715 RepID=UPI00285B2A60|nr:TonB-dependent siderophore receptor [Methylobacterium sp. BE186]MDR7035457.1 iron complex outermembrane receptor protein [Methylobacterium sp. BE186]
MRARPLSLRLAATVALAPPAGAGSASAQERSVQLDQIAVEGSGVPQPGPGIGNGAATSGGGGGPSGVVGYTAKASPTATKTNTPLIETPQSVTVVTREQLNDRNVQDLNQALAYAPGTSTDVFGFDPRFDAFYIRGFSATYDGVFRDGLRQSAVGLAVPRIEPYGTEAVTILRGPASGLYGLGSPGGIVDVTTKRPVFARFGELWFQGGNYDRFQGNFDFGGPVEGSDGTMAYRLTGIVRQSDTFLPGATDDRFNIAPAFTWKPSADTTFTLLTEFQNSKLPGTSAFYNFPGFRVSRYYQGDGAFNAFTQQQYRIGYAFEHKVSPDLIVRQNFRYYGVNGDFPYVQIDSVTGLTAQRSTGLFIENLHSVALDNQIEGHVQTGPIAHTLLGGLDYLHFDWDRVGGFGTAPDLDLATLNYGRQFIPRPVLTLAARQSQDQVGLYLQEQAKWDRFVLTLTGRHDWVSQTTASGVPGALGPSTTQNDTAFTGRVGLNYTLAPGLVPYASYATTFTPQVGADASGRAFRPATGDQIEAGVKYAVPGTNITAAFAGFDIVQTSILRQDPANLAFTVATGEVRSRGFEGELIANLAPGTNLTLAYTHLNFQFVSQTSLVTGQPIDGNTLSGIPGDTIKVFGTYLFPPSSPLHGLQIGGGIRYASSSFADDENTVRNPTVTLFDALIAYDFAALDPKYAGFRAQVNAFNIFDRDYTNCQAGFCYRGAPATVIGSLIYRW